MISDLAFGLLLLRAGLGLAIAAHGAQKTFGWFGGHGIAGTGGFFEMLGFRPGRLFAAAAGVSELAGGLLMTAGLLGAVGPMLVVSTMVVAILAVHWKNGFFAATNGYELAFVYGLGAAALAFAGYGSISLDAAIGLNVTSQPIVVSILLLLGVVGGLSVVMLRRAPEGAASAS